MGPAGTSESLGGYIRLRRQLADLSLRRLSELTNISNAYLSQVERGLHQPSLRVLQTLASALDISTDVLLSKAGVEPSQGGITTDTESVLNSDPDISAEQRAALIAVYRCMRNANIELGNSATGTSTATG